MSMRTRYARASAFVNVRLSGWKSFSQIRHRCMTKQQRNLLRAGRQTAILMPQMPDSQRVVHTCLVLSRRGGT